MTNRRSGRWACFRTLRATCSRLANVLGVGDHIDRIGPIALEESTEIRAAAFVLDPQLGRIDTPHGAVAFVQVVGLTMARIRRGAGMDTEALLETGIHATWRRSWPQAKVSGMRTVATN